MINLTSDRPDPSGMKNLRARATRTPLEVMRDLTEGDEIPVYLTRLQQVPEIGYSFIV